MPVNIEAWYLVPILMAPLIGFAINATVGALIQRRFGKPAVHAIALMATSTSLVFAFYAIFQVAFGDVTLVARLWTWFDNGPKGLSVPFELVVDRLTAVMLFVVTFVGTLIHIFSIGYMRDERPYWRFFAWMNLFMFSMLLLVLGSSLPVMFIGWEGVGLCSYLLISYYYEESDKAAAGMKAFVVNRVGDFAFIVGMALLLWAVVGSWDEQGRISAGSIAPTLRFEDLKNLISDAGFRESFISKTVFGVPVATLVCILLFVGATGKSAQIPLYVWLPDAMAGPTPVSALIHAATMVTAGVYMVARLNFLYVLSPTAMTIVAMTGAITALFAATIGFFQTDIKKVLAYSTVSQLGYMFLGVGVGAFSAGIFHLMTHAFFKACLFLCSGSIIYALHHRQDISEMGGLRKVLPVTYWTFLAATLAIAGIPGTAGFFSKDEILFKAFDNANTLIPGWVLWLFGLIAALFTAFYMTRLLVLTFFGEPRCDEHVIHHAREYRAMTGPLVILAILSIAGGFIGVPEALGGSNHFEHFLAPVFESSESQLIWLSSHGGVSHATEYALMVLAICAALIGIYSAFRLYGRKYRSPEDEARIFGASLYRIVASKYFVDEAYDLAVVRPLLSITRIAARFDKVVIDGIVNATGFLTRLTAWINGALDSVLVDGAVNGLATMTLEAGSRLRRIETGKLQSYIVGIITGVTVLVIVTLWVVR